MEKNKFISDRIQKLIKEGKDRNQAIAISYAEYNSMNKMQQGGDIAYNDYNSTSSIYSEDPILPKKVTIEELKNYSSGVNNSNNSPNSNLKNIDMIQSGVLNTKLGRGYYVYTSDGQREFVTENAYQNTMKGTPNLNKYLKLAGAINRKVPGTENKTYKPLEIPSKLQEGGFYNTYNPYGAISPGYKTPTTNPTDYNANYMNLSEEDENLKPLISNKIPSKEEYDQIRIANLYGNVNPQVYGYGLGKAIEEKDGFGAVVNGLGLGLGTAKNILSGIGDSRVNNYTYNQYKQNQLDDSSEYKSLQEGGYIPQLKKKENSEVSNQDIDKTNAELLTGEYLIEDNSNPNVEVESDEKVLHGDTGNIQTAEGNKHKDGGIKVQLSEQSKVLSDYTKINLKNSKYFSDIFNIKANSDDTFAKVLDKIENKIGLKKLLKEEEELNLKIEKLLQKDNPDKQTKDLNLQLLSEYAKELIQRKQELNEVRKIAFEELFEKQELIPKKSKNGEILKQEGGEIQEQITPQQIIESYAQLIQKDSQKILQSLQQMSEEKQQEALSQMFEVLQQNNSQQEMKRGGEVVNPEKNRFVSDMIRKLISEGVSHYEAVGQALNSYDKMQEGGKILYAQDGIRIANDLENQDLYKKQNATNNSFKTFGKLLKDNPQEVLNRIKKLHPELYTKYFKDNEIPTYDKIRSFQEGINSKYESIKNDYIKTYGKDSQKVKDLEKAIQNDKFLPLRNEYDEKQDRIINKEVRGLDSYLGDFTSTRPNFAIDIIPENELKYINDAGVNTAFELKDKFPDIFKKYVEPKGLTSDFWLGKVVPQEPIVTEKEKIDYQEPSTREQNIVVNKGVKNVIPNIPTYYGTAPTPLEPVYKGDISLGRLNPNKISIEPNLVEANRQFLAAQDSLEGLSPTQRAVALNNIYTQNQNATNQAISQAQIANANSQLQTDQFNIGQSAKEDITNLQNALNYEQRNLGGKARYEANLARYFNNIAEVDKQNWRDINNLNLLNARSDNFQTDGTNFYRTQENSLVVNPLG
jgi:hypothetical protein